MTQGRLFHHAGCKHRKGEILSFGKVCFPSINSGAGSSVLVNTLTDVVVVWHREQPTANSCTAVLLREAYGQQRRAEVELLLQMLPEACKATKSAQTACPHQY